MLDEIDRKLLNLLQDDATLTHKQLASELNLTVTPVFERIKKLRKKGIITGIHASIDRRKIDKPLMAFCEVSVSNHKKEYLENFENKVMELEEVVECHHVSGNHDYILKVVENSMDNYRDFLVNKLAKIDGVSNVNSAFVMKELKEGYKVKV